MVRLEAHEWYYGVISPDDLAAYLKQPGDFLVRAWDNGNGVELYLSFKKECLTTETGTSKLTTSNENVTQQDDGSEEKEKAHLGPEDTANISHHGISFNDQIGGWGLKKDQKRRFKDVSKLIDYYHYNELPGGGRLVRGSTRPKYLLKRGQVTKWEKLGSGNFCDVFRGELNEKQEVAVKICHKIEGNSVDEINKATESLIEEARIMSLIDHPNIVKFMGLCCEVPPVMMIMELCVRPLIGHLTKDGEKITHGEKIRYSIDIAEGMSYLQSKNLVHRDLAARNCLFSKKGICKIADFGLSKLMRNLGGEKSGTAQMPVRWMAPETLQTSPVFSPKSDIWSYGVLLFEIFTNGNKPFNGDDWPLKKVATYIRKGKMVDPPETAPADIQDLMKECWRLAPEERMDFDAIVAHLKETQVKYPQPHPDELVLAQITGITILPSDRLLQVVDVEEMPIAKKVMHDAKMKKRSHHHKDKHGENHDNVHRQAEKHQKDELGSSVRRRKQNHHPPAQSPRTTQSPMTTQSPAAPQRCSVPSPARRSNKHRKNLDEESSASVEQAKKSAPANELQQQLKKPAPVDQIQQLQKKTTSADDHLQPPQKKITSADQLQQAQKKSTSAKKITPADQLQQTQKKSTSAKKIINHQQIKASNDCKKSSQRKK